MNANAKKWVKALRSGKYKQTTGTLHNKDGYCCLGVACEVAIQNGVNLKVEELDDIYSYDNVETNLPFKVIEWLNIRDIDGEYGDTYRESLVYHNDTDNYNFDQIADVIEEHEEGLFNA